MSNQENPFFYGRAVRGDCFVNRAKEQEELTSSLARGQSVILFSPRRYGKTSLMTKVLERLRAKGVLCFYVDLYRVTRLEEFYRYYSKAVVSAMNSPAAKLFQAIRELIPTLKPKLTYSEPGAPSIEIEAGLETLRRTATLQELFDSVEKLAASRKKRACIVFDEFQEITSMTDGDLVEREMRAAFQHHQRVSYAFLGSAYHLMSELFADKNRPFYNFGMRVELDVIAEQEWHDHIRTQFSKAGRVLDSSAFERIAAIAKGHPYYTQLLCSELWRVTEGKKNVTAAAVDVALEASIAREAHAFGELWDTLSSAERRSLIALAQEGPVRTHSAEFVAKYALGAHSSLQRTTTNLVKRGIVARKGGLHCVTDPLLIQWILQSR